MDMERAFCRSIMTIRVPIVDDREKYMDKPVRIMAVEGSQVVIEEDGERKLLERKYIDDCWTDYERLLHPEEEEKCGKRILWVRMKSGKNMPVDMELHNYKKDSTGKEKIVTPDGEVVTGRIIVGEHGDGTGYISHFASCKKYRR